MHKSKLSATIVALSLLLLCLPSSAQKKSHSWSYRAADSPQIPGAARVGSDVCTTCHSEVATNFRHAYHAQQGVECEDCHGSGSLHVEGGGDVSKIIAFSKRPAGEADQACLACHARDERVRHWASGSHAANHVRCTECHQIHGRALKAANEGRLSFDTATRGAFLASSVSPETDVKLRPPSATNSTCLKCHQTEAAQLSMPYHHPLREGKMSCVDCHDPHGGPAGNNLRVANVNQLCLGCHAQYRGPYAYQHPPVTENCMLCHTAHGSPNTNLLSVSEPALCLQCHAGHHNGAGLPLADRCTNCHVSIHGTDVATPSGGSRFVDKGPSERALVSGDPTPGLMASHPAISASSTAHGVPSTARAFAPGALSGMLAMMASGPAAPLSGANMMGGAGAATETGAGGSSAFSFTPAAYRFVDGTGFLGRVGEYDTLEQSAGADMSTAYVSTLNKLTVVSRGNVVSGDDYSAATQVTAGDRLEVGLFVRSFVQQQDHYPFYAFPFLDVPPGTPTPCIPGSTCVDTTTDLIPPQSVFGVKRRLGNAYARVKLPNLPVHLFVKGDWQARVGVTQLAYLDENVGNSAATCGAQCHFNSQFQPLNYTTRNVGGGAQVDLGRFQLTWEHTFSSFNDRLQFPLGTYGGFFPEVEGISSMNPPPSGPAPADFPAGNYPLDLPSPSQASTDSLSLSWTASSNLSFNGNVSYTRLRDLFTGYRQNSFGSDETLNWRPVPRLRVTADYHQQNLVNAFTPYYSLYGNVSYHNHNEGLRLDYELPRDFDVEAYYTRGGITRSNAALWPQIYSIDNTDLLTVVPSSFSNTTGFAVRYHDRSYWSARAGYEWTGTHQPGYLIVPQSNNRIFANVWLTPSRWLVFSNDVSVILQNAFPDVTLLRADGNGLSGNFQRHNRFYVETASATFRFVPGWNLALGYSYQQNSLTTYMAFQNDAGVGYVINEPGVPYKQITQAYWGESTYTFEKRWGLNFRLTYNSSRSGLRPDVNPADAGLLGNAALLASGSFDPGGLFPGALGNLEFAATQISQVIVPQWIGESKGYYHFPYKFEGGLIFYYGSYRDYWNPNLNGVLRTYSVYVGRSW
jgi:predicted CXXCH cytochrome family protein